MTLMILEKKNLQTLLNIKCDNRLTLEKPQPPQKVCVQDQQQHK